MRSSNSSPDDLDAIRLPRSVTPTRYDLRIEPDIDGATFEGTERIALVVETEVDEFVCNSVDLEISQAVLEGPNGETYPADVRIDNETERAYFRPTGGLTSGTWSLSLAFKGVLNDKLRGFYRSRFTDNDGKERWIATTQFEATDARRAFPCWDEPDFKAVFSVTLVAPLDLTAVSNGAVVEIKEIGEGRKEVKFSETILMSTYLVAFVVGPLHQTRPEKVRNVPLSIIYPPGKGHLTDFAMEAGRHALAFFSDWFGIPYPSDKLDLIAIPDFAFGAMENLGAVTFRESVLLVDPVQASRAELERVAVVVSHEIAHMWFGDLVTMKWWNGLWLNEAFATFMEVLCVDHFRPDWDMWSGFAQERDDALAVDGLAGTRAIENPVRHPKDAEDMFDRLTYEKGGAVLRMLEQYLGAERFRDGIRLYIARHSFANAETTDLWDALEESTGEPVRTLMDSWIFQGGHPLVRVSVETDPAGEYKEGQRGPSNANVTMVTASQSPFCYLAGDKGAIGDIWHVPLKMRTLGSASPREVSSEPNVGSGARDSLEQRFVLDKSSANVQLNPLGTAVVANSGGNGVYRTMYDAALTERMRPLLSTLTPLERTVIASDAWALAISGKGSLAQWATTICDIAKCLGQGNDPEPGVWNSVTGSLSLLDHISEEPDRPALQTFVQALLRPVLDQVGFDPRPGEAPLTGSLRGRLLAALGTIGSDPQVKEWAAVQFAATKTAESALAPDLVRPMLACVAAQGSTQEYELFVSRYRQAKTPQDEMRYLFGLTEFSDGGLLERTLAFTDTEVRSQNAYFMYSLCLGHREHGLVTWHHIEQHWDQIVTRVPSNSLGRLVGGIEAQADNELLGLVETFLQSGRLSSGVRQASLALQRLRAQAEFADRERPQLSASLTGALGTS